MSIEIDVSSVIKSLELLAEELRRLDVNKKILSDDEYWEVDVDCMFNMNNNPSLLVGSIKDDYQYLLDFDLVGLRYIYGKTVFDTSGNIAL